MIANVFVVHTPFQRFAAQYMLKVRPDLFNGFNRLVMVSESPAALQVDRALWSDIIEAPSQLLQPFTPARMRSAWEWARRSIAGLERFTRVHIHVSNVDILLPNALLALARTDSARLKLCVYPEGIGTLFRPTLRRRKRLKNLVKTAWGRVSAAVYTNYGDDLNGFDPAATIFSFVPGLPHRYLDKVVELPFPEAAHKEPNEGWLVLGDSNAWIPQRQGDHLAQALIDYVVTRPGGTLIYKPHHHSRGHDIEAFARAGFSIMDDTRPVEEIFMETPVRNVISVISSALLHLKAFYGDKIECTAFHMGVALSYFYDNGPRYYEDLRAAYRTLGVRIVD